MDDSDDVVVALVSAGLLGPESWAPSWLVLATETSAFTPTLFGPPIEAERPASTPVGPPTLRPAFATAPLTPFVPPIAAPALAVTPCWPPTDAATPALTPCAPPVPTPTPTLRADAGLQVERQRSAVAPTPQRK